VVKKREEVTNKPASFVMLQTANPFSEKNASQQR
jgi:hypothetical protein